jgi:uncharacterized protein with LGFP repeats
MAAWLAGGAVRHAAFAHIGPNKSALIMPCSNDLLCNQPIRCWGGTNLAKDGGA